MSVKRINPKYNVALMASAGTGKTYNLALRVVTTLMRDKTVYQPVYDITGENKGEITGTSFGKLLCITFTRKATAEMANRVNEYLTKLANGQLGEGSDEYKSIASVLKIASPHEMRSRAGAVLATLFRDPSILQIRTIDSFVNMVLRLFPFESEVSPDFDILDSDSTQAVKYEAFETVFQLHFDRDEYHELFNRYISWAGLTPKSFITKLRDNVIKYVLERSVTIEKQLKAAAEMTLHDIKAAMDGAEGVGESIRACLRAMLEIIHEMAERYAMNKNFSNSIPLLEATAKGKVSIDDGIGKIDSLDPCRSRPPFNKHKGEAVEMPEIYHRLYTDINGYAKSHVEYAIQLEMMLLLHTGALVQAVMSDMQAKKGILSFSDVTYAVYHMLQQPDYGISNEYLYFRLDGRLEHILIDEFQDTSDVQWKLIKPLADEAMAGVGQGGKLGSFFCVGDPKQTIYRFRGSDPNFFHNVIIDCKGKLREEKLLKNFRSDKAPVDFVNRLFAGVDGYLEGGDSISFEFTEQEASSTVPGYVSMRVAVGESAKDLVLARLDCLKEQLQEIMDVVGWKASDIAILVSKRETGFQVQQYLGTLGIKSYATFAEKLAETDVYKAVNALLKYIYYSDYFALAEFCLTEPPILAHFNNNAEIERLQAELDAVLAASEGRPVYERLIKLEGRFSLIDRYCEDPNFILLMDLMGLEAATVINPVEFASKLASLAKNTSAAAAKGGEGISIMTVHGSKGLEFPVVIVHDINKNFQFHPETRYFINEASGSPELYRKRPSAYKPYNSADYQAAEDLEAVLMRYGLINELYVAVTRAKNVLYYTAGMVPTKSGELRKSTDAYVLSVFPEGCTMGVLPRADSTGSIIAPRAHRSTPYTELYTDLIAQPAKHASDPEVARATLASVTEKYPAVIFKRAEEYLEKLIDTGADETEFSYEPYLSRIYGTFVHEALYQMDKFSVTSVDAAVDKAFNRYGAYLAEGMKDKARNALLLLVSNEQFCALLSGARLYREKNISNKGKPLVVDLYAVKNNEIAVIDFKTGASGGARHEEYLEQVKGYMYAISKQYKRKTRGFLVYLNDLNLEIEEILLFSGS